MVWTLLETAAAYVMPRLGYAPSYVAGNMILSVIEYSQERLAVRQCVVRGWRTRCKKALVEVRNRVALELLARCFFHPLDAVGKPKPP